MLRDTIRLERTSLLQIRDCAETAIPGGGRPAQFINDLFSGVAFVEQNACGPTPALHVRGVYSLPWRSIDMLLPVGCRRQTSAAVEEVKTLLDIDPGHLSASYPSLVSSGRWDTFWIKRGREWNPRASEFLPKTFKLVKSIPRLEELAFVSVLAPYSKVGIHCGPWNLRTNLHLGVCVPEGCGLSVDRESKVWSVGEWIAFDDDFAHEVWNHSNSPRTVLVANVWNPDLSDVEIQLFSLISETLKRAESIVSAEIKKKDRLSR